MDGTDEGSVLDPDNFGSPDGFADMRAREAELFNTLLANNLPAEVTDWTVDEKGWTFELEDLTIEVLNDEDKTSIVATSNTISRKSLDPIRTQLRLTLQNRCEMACNVLDFAVILLQLVEEAVLCIQLWKDPPTKAAISTMHDKMTPLTKEATHRKLRSTGWQASSINSWESVLSNSQGLNVRTVADVAYHLLDESIADICARFPAYLRILHVEPVFRNDLAAKFSERRRILRERLSELPYPELRKCVSPKTIAHGSSRDNREDLSEELARPTTTFHGAPRRVISSIVRYGFLKPGDKVGGTGNIIGTHAGASFGVGVYSSPDPLYASAYTSDVYTARLPTIPDGKASESSPFVGPEYIPGMRILVCATLIGRAIDVSRADARGVNKILNPNADSHIARNGLEYIVFDTAQIIPCYAIHLDWGSEQAMKDFNTLSKTQKSYERLKREMDKSIVEPGTPDHIAIKARKDELKASVRKYLPFGFGPASGKRFVIEDMAEVSDDEEVHGEFQQERMDDEDEDGFRDYTKTKIGNWFDEYQAVRKLRKDLDVL